MVITLVALGSRHERAFNGSLPRVRAATKINARDAVVDVEGLPGVVCEGGLLLDGHLEHLLLEEVALVQEEQDRRRLEAGLPAHPPDGAARQAVVRRARDKSFK